MNDLADLDGKVAVVTGGAAGIGRGIVEALLDEGARVVIADIEEPVLDATVGELATRGEVTGIRTDVSDFDSVDALAKTVFERYGACHLLFNNAGVGTGGGGYPWEQEPNDWKWCFGVNVFGVANGVLRIRAAHARSRMSPASSSTPRRATAASLRCRTRRCTPRARRRSAASPSRSRTNLPINSTKLRAAVFYPSGGLLETGLWTAARNRPPELAREREHTPLTAPTFEEFRERLRAAGMNADLADLGELGRFVVSEVKRGSFVIGHNLDESGTLLHARADAIAQALAPAAPQPVDVIMRLRPAALFHRP